MNVVFACPGAAMTTGLDQVAPLSSESRHTSCSRVLLSVRFAEQIAPPDSWLHSDSVTPTRPPGPRATIAPSPPLLYRDPTPESGNDTNWRSGPNEAVPVS